MIGTRARLVAAAAAIAVALVASSSPAAGVGRPRSTRALDAERDCRELVPAAYSAPVLADDSGERIDYDVLVFTDGVPSARARALLREAQTSYEPLSIDLKPVWRKLRIAADGEFAGRPTAGTASLFEELRRAVGGKRPKGLDAVMLLTEKSMYSFTDADGDGEADESEREHGTIGEAACAGGVRWDETAFALADAYFVQDEKQAGITVAHELGHLVGGHHHLANCTEGAAEDPATPCTVMFAASMAISSTFSSVNAALVRGHAVTYAAP